VHILGELVVGQDQAAVLPAGVALMFDLQSDEELVTRER
jgi:hypothetical protein